MARRCKYAIGCLSQHRVLSWSYGQGRWTPEQGAYQTSTDSIPSSARNSPTNPLEVFTE